ncbi:dipeptide/oligopeptide/nickel ABC transporter ATP-binding protein [Micromonospora craterilacus]|uniref:Dipeptide/oligopeptide/nickel ABC transporter ATP-binding protein n=1 Tax=Micromonospora craterilacus TaxID=1655439 RepID=A0A2W2DZ92_9ACTN|nr:oligopeptide/dipeptide ABC transporter ATP-binding protein [Micromonospora craterilacus]PZG17276.1 dipeptide/oligopeptide/nickel ABC transporter ATP-binding protein [Micromonospora craterilacus]
MSLLQVRDLKVHFPIKAGNLFTRQHGSVQAVDGVDLDVAAGTTFGLVGESGCGKSTLARAIMRLVEPTAGSVALDGQDLLGLSERRLRPMRRDFQMVFQDPMASLDPRQNVESLLTEPLRAHKIPGGPVEHARRIRELLEVVGLPATALERYPHEFSGGQRQRIGIARALVLSPKLIVADEPVSALDVSVQAQVINLLKELQERFSLTYLVIAHDLAVVRHISDTVAVMYLGSIIEQAPADQLYRSPTHPYTKALMGAVPVPDPAVEVGRNRILLQGDLPSPANPPAGCRFHTRCPWRQASRCAEERPALRTLTGGHQVACHYAEDIAAGRIQPSTTAAPRSTATVSQHEPAELLDSRRSPGGR